MPVYDFCCGEHTTTRRAGIDLEAILCPVCGKTAPRVPVYESQYIICETGPKGGRDARSHP